MSSAAPGTPDRADAGFASPRATGARAAIDRDHGPFAPGWSGSFSSGASEPDALEFVVEVIHDLYSPLAAIAMLSDTLLRGLAETATPAQRRQLGLIYGASFSLSEVTRDVLELARGGERLSLLDPEPFSVAGMFESIRRIVRPIAEERGIELRTSVTISDYRVGQRMALDRVLLNLVTNALRSTDSGFVEISAAAIAGQRVMFAVRDTGPGIPRETVAPLYQPLRRSHDRRPHSLSDSELGLTICRKLVRGMHSELQTETRLGWGTRMFFELDLPELDVPDVQA